MSDDLTVVREQALIIQRIQPLIATPDMPIHRCPSTIPPDAAGIVRRMNAMGQSSLELDRDGTLLIEVQDVLAYPREGVDETTGEVHEYSWLVLIDPKGESWGTSSECVATKIAAIVAMWTCGLIKRPTPIQIVTRTARKSARRYHDVVMLGD